LEFVVVEEEAEVEEEEDTMKRLIVEELRLPFFVVQVATFEDLLVGLLVLWGKFGEGTLPRGQGIICSLVVLVPLNSSPFLKKRAFLSVIKIKFLLSN
jgi:hypothetical protein